MLKTQSAVICQQTLLASANQGLRETAKSGAQTSTSVRGQAHVESTRNVTTSPATSLAPASKVSKEIHMMDVPTSTSALILKLAVQAQSVRTSRVVIAATAQKVTMETLDQQDVSITTNALDHLVDATLIALTKSGRSGAIVPMVLLAMR